MKHIIIVLLALGLVSCSGDEKNTNADMAAADSTRHVRSVKITTVKSDMRDVNVIEEALGRILDPANTTISAEVPARVKIVYADVGDKVAKGAVLATLDALDMQVAVSTAEANLARQQAQFDAQDKLVERYRTLSNDKFVSTTVLEQAEAQLVSLQKAVNAAKAQLKQAKNNLSKTRVIAPVAGTVQKRFVAEGDYLGVGKPLFQLVTSEDFMALMTIPETKMSTITAGLPVRMHLPNSTQIIEGHIDDLAPMIGSASNGFEARIKFKNPGGWRAGGSVIVDIIVATHKQAVVVPEACVVLRPAGEVVYVIQDGKAKAQHVTTGVRRDGYIEIIQGLEANVLLAETGASFLSDGAVVSIKGAQ
ncbi:MAG: efflux RND transporter periplasmic adaptor subunit [Ghiorsea sp.]|nr:efflux RND transporter periplasmic adaptor subunit [Ghiorsea sp.]